MNYENPYPGVNAHLNSFLQSPKLHHGLPMWLSFRSLFLSLLVEHLNQNLPDGYIAFADKSIQLPAEIPDQPHIPRMIAIYESGLKNRRFGYVVCWIDMLMPEDLRHPAYADQRLQLVLNGASLVEINFAHESPAADKRIPRYPIHNRSHAYHVAVFIPRPTSVAGRTALYEFGVGEAFPKFEFPLFDETIMNLEIGSVYNRTFTAGRWSYFLDYTAVPERFDTYSAADQARIVDIMKKIGGQA